MLMHGIDTGLATSWLTQAWQERAGRRQGLTASQQPGRQDGL
jgi:hypothetical protein